MKMIDVKGNRLTRSVPAYAALCLLAMIPAAMMAQDARTVLANAAKAMGAENVRTLEFSGMGSSAGTGIGQSRNPATAWPVARVKAYTRQIDIDAGRSQTQIVRVQDGKDQTERLNSVSDSPWNDQYSFWLTPFGFIKGALANNASLSSATVDGKRFAVVTFSIKNIYKIIGYINDENLVERVQTWIDNDVLGDMPVEVWYSGYKDYAGLRFPSMIVEKQAGFPVTIISVANVKPNMTIAAADMPPSSPSVEAAAVQSEKIADGVYLLERPRASQRRNRVQ